MVALTHNSRIRYTPNEKRAVISHGVRLQHEPPFIAKVYRALPAELAKNTSAPGHIALWV